MEKSSSITELAKALNKFQSLMGTVVFDANNPFFKSKYATLTNIVAKSKPILAECGLAVSQPTEGDGGVTTILMHTSGEYICSTLTLKSVKDDPQGHGSAITYARRYSYASILGIVSDEDDDGNQSSYGNVRQANEMPTRSLETQKKPIVDPSADLNEQKISSEQGTAILKLMEAKGWVKKDLVEFIQFEFEIKSILDIQNKHLMRIKEYFSKQKVKDVKDLPEEVG